jgi:hypothetical protein
VDHSYQNEGDPTEPIPKITKHALDTGMVTMAPSPAQDRFRGADGSDFASDRSPNRVSRLYPPYCSIHHNG